MPKDTCLMEDCARPAEVRGICRSHYVSLRRRGKVDDHALPARGGKPRHDLSDLDVEAKTATCSVCGPVNVMIRGSGNRCKKAHAASNRERRGTHVVRGNDGRRFRYGLSAEAYAALLARANGACEICGVQFGAEDRIDHCHETGQVRGVLCDRCNKGLGWFDDSMVKLLGAYMYLSGAGQAERAS